MSNIDKVSKLLESVDNKQDYDIVADLQSLERSLDMLKRKDFRRKLKGLIEKYQTSEITEIRKALIEKCRVGDTNAIRLYLESFKPTSSETEDDGLTAALLARGKEVFADEN